MVTTSPDALYSPDSTDDYDLIVDLAAMQTSTQTALNNRVRHYTASTYTALNALTGVVAGSSGYVTTDQRFFRHNGTKWMLIAGNVPRANVRLASDTTINTTYAGLNTQSGGIAVSGNFTVPAGCAGTYDFTFNASVATETANVYTQPFVNSTASNKEVLSGGQRAFSNGGYLDLNAGDVVQFRARVFSGSASLTAANTWMSLAFRNAI